STQPSMVGTGSLPPSAARAIGSGILATRFWPSRRSQSCSRTLIVIRRLPGSPPNRPGSPCPRSSFSGPPSVPGGNRTSNDRCCLSTPRPRQVVHGSCWIIPSPSQRPHLLRRLNSPPVLTSPPPLQLGHS